MVLTDESITDDPGGPGLVPEYLFGLEIASLNGLTF